MVQAMVGNEIGMDTTKASSREANDGCKVSKV
jgi:hypothetical protein